MTKLRVFLIVLCYYNWWTSTQVDSVRGWERTQRPYNSTYPLTQPLATRDAIKYRIGIIADLDKNSKSPTKSNTFISYFKKGYLNYNPVQQSVSIEWDPKPPTVLTSTYSHKGRGMELSELIVYDGKLLTFDDRSGLVYIIENDKVVPWVILMDGNGHTTKGFKSEWVTLKDDLLYVGSMGKEWTTPGGEFQSYDPMWVKVIDMNGEVQHQLWVMQYKAVRRAIGINWPGYMIHESGVWSAIKRQWHFLPRRCSRDTYNETIDEVNGCNYLITADDDFKVVQAKEITRLEPKLGFSSFKFIPGTGDEAIVALKTTEFEGKTSTYISAFTTDGTVLLPDTLVENQKYEGLEFI